ncbi:MAG: hypothetical protein KDA36_06995, partial [Planctomycetaceae bacterium]|nr:hypothetical protein [Planctomycetaceae bacterium]
QNSPSIFQLPTMPPQTTPPSNPLKLWKITLRCSVPLLVLLMLLLLYNSLFSPTATYIRRIESLGGNVYREKRFPNMIAELLPSAIGEGRIVGLYIENPAPQESEIAQWLQAFPNLQRISLWNTQTTDELIDEIMAHRELQFLWLCKTNVTDVGIEKLSRQSSLSGLYLDETPITDEAIAHLVKLSQLNRLSCANTNLTDASVDHFLRMPDLGQLDVHGTKISQPALDRLRQHQITLTPNLPGPFPYPFNHSLLR